MVWNLYLALFHSDHVLCCDLFLSLSQRTRKFILVLTLHSCLESPPIQQLNIYFQPQARELKHWTAFFFFCLFICWITTLLYMVGKSQQFSGSKNCRPWANWPFLFPVTSPLNNTEWNFHRSDLWEHSLKEHHENLVVRQPSPNITWREEQQGLHCSGTFSRWAVEVGNI